MAQRVAGGGGELWLPIGPAARPPVLLLLRRPRCPRGELLRGDALYEELRRRIQGRREPERYTVWYDISRAKMSQMTYTQPCKQKKKTSWDIPTFHGLFFNFFFNKNS